MMTPPATASVSDPRQQALLLRACRREPVERTPVWLMRQAGRYLPEYRAIREKVGFLELCKTPRLSAEVMIATVNRLGVDAAIIFSDLLPILEPMGMDLEFAAGEGPVIHNPLREADDEKRLRELADVDPLSFVFDCVRSTRRENSRGKPGSNRTATATQPNNSLTQRFVTTPTVRQRLVPDHPESGGTGQTGTVRLRCGTVPVNASAHPSRASACRSSPKAVNPSTGGDEAIPTLRVPLAAPVTRT
jgi:hypothetical protein